MTGRNNKTETYIKKKELKLERMYKFAIYTVDQF